jgi:hypothetical protein
MKTSQPMKNLILFISFSVCSILTNAQIGIGIENNTNSRTLDFDNMCDSNGLNCQNKKGIILPAVDRLPLPTENLVNGTMLLDKNGGVFRVYENDTWKKLSFLPGDLSSIISVTNTQEVGNGVILGPTPTSPVNGVLILEDPNRALALPKIHKPYDTVPNPYPGMICYDTDSKSLMLFDGSYWNIWREKKIN